MRDILGFDGIPIEVLLEQIACCNEHMIATRLILVAKLERCVLDLTVSQLAMTLLLLVF
jgi:hypothetical protein